MDSTELFKKHIGQTSPFPLGLEVMSAKGVFYTTVSGNKVFDFTSGISVNNLGHGHPNVVNAIKKQADIHLHTMVFGEFVEAPQLKLAQALSSVLPESLSCTYYCTSGGEAVEAAMKLSKRYTGRTEICYFEGSYHGSTHGALSIMGDERYKQAYRPLLPNTRMLGYNNEDDLQFITTDTAGVVVELVQAASGVTVGKSSWLSALRARCSEVGALLIFDEIQTGFGRTGKLFGFEHNGVVPDVLLLAKAMGSGVPIGALITSTATMECLSHHPILGHINTFGGNALACAAAQATLDTFIAHPELYEQAERKGKLIIQELSHPAISHFTQKGLMLAVHFKDKTTAHQFIEQALIQDVVLIGFLFNEAAVRISPPLTITDDEIKEACTKLRVALDKL